MRHIVFEESDQYKIAFLVKASAFKQSEIQSNYVSPLTDKGIPLGDMIAFTLEYNEVNKAPAKFIKEYLDTLLPALDSIQYLQQAFSFLSTIKSLH
jgi:hypothetical protein